MYFLRIIAAVLLFFCYVKDLNSSNNPGLNEFVTIQVLSKQLRLIKEGKLNELILILPDNSKIEDRIGLRYLNGNMLKLSLKKEGWHISIGSSGLKAPFDIKVYIPEGDAVVQVNLPGEKRIYPLPMTIQSKETGLSFYVNESLQRYAIDSAVAEYGIRPVQEQEAVIALAHLIMARYYYSKKIPHHKNYDFCDLTHCQVYRGRINSKIVFNDNWIIDWYKLQHEIFFHSRCGGHTFDLKVFGNSNIGIKGIRDWYYREGIILCKSPDLQWQRSISIEELKRIIFPKIDIEDKCNVSLHYDKDTMKIYSECGTNTITLSPETFRLKINRKKGWSFIKSNQYTIFKGTDSFEFKGAGLGHGVGLCQHGALELSRRGYNRYEIIEHYFPDISFMPCSEISAISPYLSYYTFNIITGKDIQCNNPSLLLRKVPPGSFFKLIVTLYLAIERPDLFRDYQFTCTGHTVKDSILPDRCWEPKGHGTIMIEDALAHSCNLFFASLYKEISSKKFYLFFNDFCKHLDIDCKLPKIKSEKAWAKMLAGLDFRISFTAGDLIKIIRLLYPDATNDIVIESYKNRISIETKNKIHRALIMTFLKGTASGNVKVTGSLYNYKTIQGQDINSITAKGDIWGKTSTVIDGTNKPLSYGLFIGGYGNTGIIAVLRKANGHLAAKWGLKCLIEK